MGSADQTSYCTEYNEITDSMDQRSDCTDYNEVMDSACYKQFSFSHKVFYSYISIVRQNAILCGNGLMGKCAIWFHSGKSKVKVTIAVSVFPGQTSSL